MTSTEELLELQRAATKVMVEEALTRNVTKKKRKKVADECPIRITDVYMILEAIAKVHDVPKASREAISSELCELFNILQPSKFSKLGLQIIYNGFVNEPRKWTLGKLVDKPVPKFTSAKAVIDKGEISPTCPRCLRTVEKHSNIICAVIYKDGKWYRPE